MPTYAIGDIQGCYSALQDLLTLIQFDKNNDTLWFTGDLVNRGPQSLETLRFIKSLGKKQITVLGNHDLHLLAVSHGAHSGSPDDTLQEILAAPDRDELLQWLSQQPLLHHDDSSGFIMVHAGLAASWDLDLAKQLAHEVEQVLQSENNHDFFRHMYGNHPDLWDANLTGYDRLRCITNYFTRARFCYPDGRLELKNKGKVEHAEKLIPWFNVPDRKNKNLKIIFGHWAALGGVTNTPNVFALDTGCIWGFTLTAMRLEDGELFSVSCQTTRSNVIKL
jgi:bis(5'-nucleosyl)-tetraphosphatase (symmetrical)